MSDNVEFIKKCGLSITISPIKNHTQFGRSLELIKRTNQLNLSARWYSEEEFEALLEEKSAEALVVYAKDNFGDYGQVTFIYLMQSEDKVLITEFAMSCRVAAKYVENALFEFLRNRYNKSVELLGIRTDRNGVLVSSITKAGFTDKSADGRITLVLERDTVIKNNDVVRVKFEE